MSSNEWDPLLETDWGPLLRAEFEKPYWERLQSLIGMERRNDVFPPPGQVFRTLLLTSCADTKVVVVGQDPYHDTGQAHGLCFSVPCEVDTPPSLRNIYTELRNDEHLDVQPPDHGNLEQWADRGVLLLNTMLTVRKAAPKSHEGWGWETFTDEVIRVVNRKSDAVVFMLWGQYAQRKRGPIDSRAHTVICSSHPSPQSAYSPPKPFFGSRPFSRANDALVKAGREGIHWALDDCPDSG